MQTTLLGLAIAVILAIVAALIAPLVVDWNHYRSAFEAEASRVTGLDVHVTGAIDARILPSPIIKLRNVEIGEAGQEPRLHADAIDLEVGLGPLLRGEVQASKANFIAPQFSLGLDRSGAIDWPVMSPSFRPDTLSVSRLSIKDGRVTLNDAASGTQIVLQKLSFDGDIRSLVGPFSGNGTFVAGSESYHFRLSGARDDQARGFKIRLGVDPANYPLTTDVQGIVTLDRSVPQFDGTLALERPVGAALANGERVMSDPWRAVGKIRATPAAASLREIAFQYGPEERAVDLNGSADLSLGAHPHLAATISALEVNIDRALAAPDVTHRPPLLVIKNFLEAFTAVVKLPILAEVGVSIEALTFGGTSLQSLHGDVRFDASGWSVDHLEFRAPGLTQVSLSGRLKDSPHGFVFSGPAAVQSTDVDMLLAWLKNDSEKPTGEARSLNARGVATIADDRIAVDGLNAVFDRQNIDGRIAYMWAADNHPAALDADLRAPQLDLDALMAFAKDAAADSGFEPPRRGSLALDIGQATLAGIGARAIKTQAKFDAGELQIDRLSIGDLGGAALDIGGRIDELSSQPHGQLTLDLSASTLDGLADVVGKFAPQAANVLRRSAGRLAPAKLHGVLSVEHAATAGNTAKLALGGQLGMMRVALDGEANGELSRLSAANVHAEGRLDADDGSALAALFNLDRVIGVDQLPGRMTISAVGQLDSDLHVEGQAVASGFKGAIQGVLRLGSEASPSGTFKLSASAADLQPLQQRMTGGSRPAVPVAASAQLAVDGTKLSFTDITGAVGKAAMHGRLAIDLGKPLGIDGDIAADNMDATDVAALLLGIPNQTAGANGSWSKQPLGTGAFAAMNGTVTFKADHASFTPILVIDGLKGVARFRPSEIAFDDIDGALANGHLSGALSFRRDTNGLTAHVRASLTGADAATIAAPVDGKLTITLACDGSGESPYLLIGSLHGNGTVSLANAHFAGLDPAAFDVAMRDADRRDSVDIPQVQAAVSAAMANSRLAVPQGSAALTMVSGQINLANVILPAQDGAALSLNGILDLNNATIDTRMTLSRRPSANALIHMAPELAVTVKGPLTQPKRTLDVSALAGWLTMRAAELQTRRIESIEANRRADAAGPFRRPDPPAIRVAPRGAVSEIAIPVNAYGGMASSAKSLDLLVPALPSAVPAPRPSPIGASPQAADETTSAISAPPGQQRANTPQSAAPQPPASGSVLDFLFRPQH